MKHKPRNISVDWLNTIWLTDLPPNAKYIACYLRKFMNSQQDMAWPSYARIQGETGLSSATVCKYLDILCDEGWIMRQRGGPKVNSKYFATFPKQISTLIAKVPQEISTLGDEVGTLGAKAIGTLGAKDELNKVIKQVNKHSDDHYEFAKLMALKIKNVIPRSKPPNLDSWANDIRLLNEIDNIPMDEISRVFMWANQDSFWQTNIQSPKKLREKYPTLHSRAVGKTQQGSEFDMEQIAR